MKITVAFSREKAPDFISRQIMNKDKVNYSHALIIYEDSDNKEKVFHAVGEGVCVEPLEKFMDEHILPYTFHIPLNVSKDFFLGYIEGSKGKEYSQQQIASIASGKPEAVNGDEKMICSELVGIVLTRMANYKIPGHQDTWRPVHCLEALQNGHTHELN